MAKITISIELNEQEIEDILGGEDDEEYCDCENDTTQLKKCIKDEYNWDAVFYKKYADILPAPAKTELLNRVNEAAKQYNEL